MGVDYDANFGFGIEIIAVENYQESEYYDNDCGFDMTLYLDDILDNAPFPCEHFVYGDDAYSDNEDTFCIVIVDPFKDGYDITEKIKKFKEFLEQNNIIYEKEPGIVGGLHIW